MERRRVNRHGIPLYEPAKIAWPERRPATGNVKLGSCCWPGCAGTVRPSDWFHPLCVLHAFRIYERGLELDRGSDRERDTWVAMQIESQNEVLKVRRQQEQATKIRGIQPGWVYYALIDGQIKIGYAADVKKRMRSYPPTAELLAVHPGTKTLEREMHQQFHAHLQRGREWFADCDEIRGHIASVLEQFPTLPARFAHRYREAHKPGGIGRAS